MNEWDDPVREDETQALRDYLAILRRRKWYLILPAVLIFTASAAVVMQLPPLYRATGKILIEQQEIPSEWVQDTVTSFADQRIQAIRQRILTTENLTRLIKKFDLFVEARKNRPLEDLVGRMRRGFSIDMVSAKVRNPRTGRQGVATIAFSVSFDHRSPQAAHNVANDLVSLFLEENAKARTEAVAETTRFLQQEADRLNRELSGMEARIAEFKQENMGHLPEQQDLNLTLLQRAEEALQGTRRQIESMEERKTYLEAALAQMRTRSVTSDMDDPSTPQTDLASLRARYASLSAVYAEEHPDLVRLRRLIDALELSGSSGGKAGIEAQLRARRQELAAMQERYANGHPDIVRLRNEISSLEQQYERASDEPSVNGIEDPALIKTRADLKAVESELKSLRKQEEEHAEKVRTLEQRIDEMPRTEQRYLSLVRDRGNLEAKYREIRAKLSSARVSQSLEEEQKGERFTLIEPPQLPEKPIKPDRFKLLVLGFAGSLFGGFGAVVAREFFDKGVRSARAVSEATNVPVLAVISRIETLGDRRRARRKRFMVLTAVALCIAAAAAAVHVYYQPLDVLWYEKVQSRLESL